MKTTTRISLFTIAAFGLLAGGFVLGGVFGAQRAAFTANAGSLVYLISIHNLLTAGKPDGAEKTAATAINSHVEVLQKIRQWPSLCLPYALPWNREPDKNTTLILSLTRDYVSKHKDEFPPETHTFLTQQ